MENIGFGIQILHPFKYKRVTLMLQTFHSKVVNSRIFLNIDRFGMIMPKNQWVLEPPAKKNNMILGTRSSHTNGATPLKDKNF